MRIALVAAAVGALFTSPTASAQDRAVQIQWRLTEPAAGGPSTIRKGGAVPFAKITPEGLLRLGGDARNQKGSLLRNAGTRLAWSMAGGRVACEPRLQNYLSFICFEDADGDGKFDGYAVIEGIVFRGNAALSHEFLIGSFPLPPRKPLAEPVAVLDDTAAYPPLDLALAFLNHRLGVKYFALCIFVDTGPDIIGRAASAKYCFPQIAIKDSELPVTRSIVGGSMTVRAIENEVATVDIKPPLASRILN